MNDRWVKLKIKTPATRKPVKSGMPHAEDQVVDGRVQQGGEHLPHLAEPGLGVHRHVAGGGEAHDEMAPLPEIFDVPEDGRPRRSLPQAVFGGQGGQRLGRQWIVVGCLWDRHGRGQPRELGIAAEPAELARAAADPSVISHDGEPTARDRVRERAPPHLPGIRTLRSPDRCPE
jgi:hypothetical protein